MVDLIRWVPVMPFLGFIILLASSGKMSKRWATWVGVGSIGLSALLTGWIAIQFMGQDVAPTTVVLWQWVSAGHFAPNFAFYVDGLAVSMLMVITGVGFLIHLYAAGYMDDDPDFCRFFVYMNLFVTAMIILVLADNLFLLFLGWEGVGLCSYLLIGFWYQKPENGYAARKAFIVTRVGDTALAIGLFMLFSQVGTLNIQNALIFSNELWGAAGVDTGTATLIALLIVGGAVGKSAQLPLQNWLPDAMAGPTPISALIHAATMVTAGVYLIARTHPLFLLSETAMVTVATIGVLTLLLSGTAALVQTDLKRILAYSTISQIGYMFVGLGVGAWSSAIFHLMTHAFFKALLFLTAGSIILALHHQQNIFKMGGLRKALPFSFWCFVVGSISLTALPPTSGFFSKEAILTVAYTSHTGGIWIWSGAILGAFITALYTFRMLFRVFFGDQITHPHAPQGWKLQAPLVALAMLALVGGAFVLPLENVFPAEGAHHAPLAATALAIVLPLLGVVVAWYSFFIRPDVIKTLMTKVWAQNVHAFWLSGWGFDALYQWLFVNPYRYLSQINKGDIIDQIPRGLAQMGIQGHAVLSQLQNGQLRFYVATIAGGAILVIAGVMYL